MNRLALLILLVVAAAAALGMAIAQDAGYVLLAYEGFRFESSLWATLGLIAVVWAVFFGLRLLLGLLLNSVGLVNPWSGRNRSRRVRLSAEQGFLDLQEGRWARAQRHLRRAAEGSEQPLMYFLGAARAAQQLGQSEEADVLLERALDSQPKAELAVALAHAELQTARGDVAGALETLRAMRQRFPGHHQVLRELAELELQVWQWRLQDAAQDGITQLANAWQQVSASLRQQPELLRVYGEQLHRLGADGEAETLLRKAIKLNYDVSLVRLYGLLRGEQPLKQLQAAEAWLTQQPKDPVLLLCLGRLCLRCELWGKARDYFEASLILQADAETCAELARLLARLGDVGRSNQLLQQGLELLGHTLPALPQPSAVMHAG